MNIEEIIREIVRDEIERWQQKVELVPIQEFCKQKKISRTTVWRAEKEGKIKLIRVGKKIFINPNQFT